MSSRSIQMTELPLITILGDLTPNTKPSIQADQFVTNTPILFKEYYVSVNKQLNNITRVTFKNVPINVPNEEILHLCKQYGKPLDNKVYFETLTNSRNKGMRGSTRYVDVELSKGSSMMNLYWLEGPFSGDQGGGCWCSTIAGHHSAVIV